MKRMQLFAVLTVAGFLMPAVLAETIIFRCGEVLAAELTRNKVKVANLAPETAEQSTCAALVTVKLHPGRTLSTHDFSLVALGGTYPCIAICEEGGGFDARKWHWDTIAPQKRYGMLFLLKIPAGGNYQSEKFTLLCNAPGTWNRTAVPFTDRKNGALTASNRVSPKGNFAAGK